MQDGSNCEVTWSFDGTTANVFYGLQYWNTIFASLNMWKGSGVNVYSFTTPSSGRTEVVGNLSAFHKQEIKRTGAGQYDLIFDNALFKGYTTASTGKIAVAKVMGGATSSSTAEGEKRFRVMRATFGDDVFLIPVVKGTQMGFYNALDGQMFLAEQECLSHGKEIGAPYTKEVEYLESTGTQWIDTGWKPDLRADFEVKGSAAFTTTSRGMLVSSYHNSRTWNFASELYSSRQLRICIGGDRVLFSPVSALRQMFDFDIKCLPSQSQIQVVANGISRTGTLPTQGQILNQDNALVGSDWRRTYMYGMYGPIKIYNPDLVRDFIPVRFMNENGQQEGAMYDKVSKRLFRNKGTGSFIIGPDKV